MTPLVFGSAGMFIDAAALPRRAMKARGLIEQHGSPAGGAALQDIELAGISQRDPSLFTTRCSLRQSPFGVKSAVLPPISRPFQCDAGLRIGANAGSQSA
jgi:hypothetical protein